MRVGTLATALATGLTACAPAERGPTTTRVTIPSADWQLIADWTVPPGDGPFPAVLLLHQAAGDRSVYTPLGADLAARQVASLQLDLRGHGESVNLGAFVPGERSPDPLIWDAEADVVAALDWLRGHPDVDEQRVAVVGASYSGEEMAEAGRLAGYATAYVALSPGSFEEASIDGIDASGVPWLFVVSREERFLQGITAAVRERSHTVELWVLPGSAHATNLLETYPTLSERIAVWLAGALRAEG